VWSSAVTGAAFCSIDKNKAAGGRPSAPPGHAAYISRALSGKLFIASRELHRLACGNGIPTSTGVARSWMEGMEQQKREELGMTSL